MRDIENEMRGYQTPLSVDLNDEIRKLTDASSSFTGLQTKRDSEVAILRDKLGKYATQGDVLASQLGGANPYDGSALEQLAAQIASLAPLLAREGGGGGSALGVPGERGKGGRKRKAEEQVCVWIAARCVQLADNAEIQVDNCSD
jgi:hypothetical protein